MILGEAEERWTLLIDQPEDDLDNALIYDLIVKQIHENKNRRQLIIVTHNPNIVVNGDVYDKFLADGGTPEILIGNVQIAGDSFLPGIVARAEDALRAYRKHEAEIVEQHDASFVSRVKSALYNAVLELVRWQTRHRC